MLKVGFLGGEGVGKTSVCTVLSLIISYLMEEEGKIAAAIDADFQKADLTNLLLGNEGFHGLHEFMLGYKFPEEVVYDPLISLEDSNIKQRLPDLVKLKVVPAGIEEGSTLMLEPIDLLSLRLKSLEEYLRKINVGILLVDLPSFNGSRLLLRVILRWIDVLIPILIPNTNSILKTKNFLFSMGISPSAVPFVILNKYRQEKLKSMLKVVQFEEGFELFLSGWGIPVYPLPYDAEFSDFLERYSVSIPKIHNLIFFRSLAHGYGRDEGLGRSVTKRLLEIFHSGLDHYSPVLISNETLKQELVRGRPNPSEDQTDLLISKDVRLREKVVPRDIFKDLETLSSSFPSIFWRKFKIRRRNGEVILISKRSFKEALLLAGLGEEETRSLLAKGELDLSCVPQELVKFVNLALLFLRLNNMEGRSVEAK